MLALFAWIAAAPARAAATPRVAVVIDELVKEQRQGRSRTEAALLQALASNPAVVVVDPEQAKGVRLATHGSSLLEADVGRLVTSLDADLLVVGEVRLEPQDAPEVVKKSLQVFVASGNLRVVAVDSAQVLGAVTGEGLGRHFTAAHALAGASDQLAARLLEQLTPLLARRPGRYELSVELPESLDVGAAEDVQRCLERVEGVGAVRLVHQGRRLLKFDVTSETEARKLAVAFGRDERCGLFVHSTSARAMTARYAPGKLMRVPLVLATFDGKRLAPRDAWLREEAPRLVATELARTEVVELPADSGLVPRAKALARQRGRLALVGELARDGAHLVVSARLVAPFPGKTLLAESASCEGDQAGACVAALGRKLAVGLLAQLQRHAAAIPVGHGLASPAPEVLEVRAVEVPDLYPAQVAGYDQGPVGFVVVRNAGRAAVTQVMVEGSLGGLGRARATAPLATLAAGAEARLPIHLDLDRAALRAQTGNRAARLEVELRYRADEVELRQRTAASVMVLDRSAINWGKDPWLVGAFIPSLDRALAERVDAVRRALPAALARDPLALPAALFASMGSLRYFADPVNPYSQEELDYVRHPRETLEAGGGDCDDLAVLYAALLEAAGREAVLIQAPGHVFVAVATGLGARPGSALGGGEVGQLLHAGKVWVPVETTRVGASFSEARARAAEQLAELQRRDGVRKAEALLVVREAWRRHAPVDLSPAGEGKALPPLDDGRVAAALAAFDQERQATLEARVREVEVGTDAKALNRAGVDLALAGRWTDAERAFGRALERAPEDPEAGNNLGNVRLATGRAREALKLYEAALERRTDSLEIVLNSVIASYLTAETARLHAHLERAYALDAAAVEELEGLLPAASGTRASEGGAPLPGLAEVLRRGRPTGARPNGARQEGGLRAQADDDAPVSRFLHWLR